MIITINADHKVISRAVGKIFDNASVDNVTTFRVDKIPMVNNSEDLYFNPKTKKFYAEKKPIAEKPSEEEIKARREATKARDEALKWLADNDWKPNKITRKEWTEDDPRWLEYLDGCDAARAKIDEAELVLKYGI